MRPISIIFFIITIFIYSGCEIEDKSTVKEIVSLVLPDFSEYNSITIGFIGEITYDFEGYVNTKEVNIEQLTLNEVLVDVVIIPESQHHILMEVDQFQQIANDYPVFIIGLKQNIIDVIDNGLDPLYETDKLISVQGYYQENNHLQRIYTLSPRSKESSQELTAEMFYILLESITTMHGNGIPQWQGMNFLISYKEIQ